MEKPSSKSWASLLWILQRNLICCGPMSNPSPAIIRKCKRSFTQVMERCVGLPEQEFIDYLKFMHEMISDRHQLVLVLGDEEDVAEDRELPDELRNFAREYS